MPFRGPARAAGHRRRSPAFPAVVVLGAASIAVLGYQSLGSSSSSAAAPFDAPVPAVRGIEPDRPALEPSPLGSSLGEEHGAVGDGVTVFDDHLPAVAKLDPALRGALRHAATDAADEGVELHVESGWRSPAYQRRLLEQAISEHGSEAEAARWVATPETSAHVSGDAVDVGPSMAAAWLAEHGAEYGLCQIYRNEPWHFELRPDAVDRGCPRRFADPTHDPRMHR